MTVVIDSNIIASLILPASYTPQSTQLLASLNEAGESLIAPLLFEYEIVSIVRRAVASNLLGKARASEALTRLLNSNIVTIPPSRSLHQEALRIAERLGQSKAYDAQYLALASRENAPLWTADLRLVRAAQAAGLGWVHWIGE